MVVTRVRRRDGGATSHFERLEPRLLMSAAVAGGGEFAALAANLPNETTISMPQFSNLWWLNNYGQTITTASSGPAIGTAGASTHAADAWALTTGSKSVVVAVFDTGTDLTHPDLMHNLWVNPGEIAGDGIDNDGNGKVDDVYGWNFVNDNNNVQDTIGHGTSVAGVIAAEGNNAQGISGVAWNLSILTIKVGSLSGVGDQALIDGINYVIALKKAGVNIVAINASYASAAGGSLTSFSAIRKAGDAGILYVAAAGNSSLNLDTLIPSQYVSQIVPSNMLWVAATDSQDNLWSQSDYGAHTVALGAPGVDITTTWPGGYYITASGTSYAAPMVAATAALLKSAVPSATMAQIKTAILNSGDLDAALVGKTITGRRVNAYKALQYLKGSQAPVGAAESFSTAAVQGWAFDANSGSTAISVKISVDGVLLPAVVADNTRSDLAATLGSSEHGFSYALPTLAYGRHAVKVYAVDDLTGVLKQIGQGTVTVNTLPIGALETAATRLLTGWAFDADTPAKATVVRVFRDGRLWLSTAASVVRSDLEASLGTANHGFAIKLPAMPAGIHKIDVYAVDALTGALVLLGSATLSSNRPATGAVETLSATTLAGWAFDPDQGGGAIQIRYQVDDFAPIFVTASALRTDLTAALGSARHGFSIALPQLMAGEHTIRVDAVDPYNKALVHLTTQVVTVSDPAGNVLPTGAVTTFAGLQVGGTVSDADATGPIKVRVDVDGRLGTAFWSTAAGEAGAPTYSFSRTLAGLGAGPHRIDVWAFDQATNVPVLIARKLINYAVVSGNIAAVTASLATGWAINSAGASKLAKYRIDVDGLTGNLRTANAYRPDLVATLGGAAYGISAALPTVTAGEHQVTISVLDPYTGEVVTLYEGVVAF